MKSWTTSNGCRITRILFGRSNVFLLSGGTSHVLVDTGWSGDGGRLLKKLWETGPPGTVIMTHTHFDHAGNAGRLRDSFSPQFIVQESEKDFLESGNSPLPKGTRALTRFIYHHGAVKVPQWFHVTGVRADIVYEEKYELPDPGFNVFILHTPGHSAGSSSVVVDHEIALVGDLMVGTPLSVFPAWGDDAAAILRSWKKILDTGCQFFHPAHGLPVSRGRLEKEFRKQTT